MGASSCKGPCKCSGKEGAEDLPQDESLPGIEPDESDMLQPRSATHRQTAVANRPSNDVPDGPEAIMERLLQISEAGDVGSARGLLAAVGPSIQSNMLHRPLQKAFTRGHLEVAELLLDTGYPLNEVDEDGDAMLHVVAAQNQLEAATLLLQKGANIEMLNAEGLSPLLVAADSGHAEMAKLLLHHGASRQPLDARLIEACQLCECEQARTLLLCGASIEATFDDYTPLLIAVNRGDLELVKLCIEKDADVNAKDGEGISALIIASKKGQVDMASFLIDQGADLSAKAKDGSNPLAAAAQIGHVKLIELLVRKKATLPAANKEELGKKLLAAVEKGNADLVRCLLLCGVSAKTKKTDGRSALMLAVEQKKMPIAKMLAAKGVDKKDKDSLGKKLLEATLKDDWELVKSLISCKANVEAKLNDGRTPLIIAAENGKVQGIKTLLAAGANKDVKTKDGRSPLLVAVEKANLELAQPFLDAGVRLTGESANKLSAKLLEAASKGDADNIKFLLRCGASADSKDLHGETALHKAAAGGKLDVAKVLLDHSASIELQGGEYGTTPLFYACSNKRVDVANFLVENGANKDGKDSEGGAKYEALVGETQGKAGKQSVTQRRPVKP